MVLSHTMVAVPMPPQERVGVLDHRWLMNVPRQRLPPTCRPPAHSAQSKQSRLEKAPRSALFGTATGQVRHEGPGLGEHDTATLSTDLNAECLRKYAAERHDSQ
jgi:hypothetical protein